MMIAVLISNIAFYLAILTAAYGDYSKEATYTKITLGILIALNAAGIASLVFM